MVEAMGLEVAVGDGHNIASSHEIMKNAVDKVRKTRAPLFLEFTTYRWREHCGHDFDNDIGYRTQEEFLEWQAKDPLNNLEWELQQTSSQMASSFERIKSEIALEVKKAFDFAEESQFPAQSDAYDGVYA
jgi:pyruvate dehydrogenase E1 component alpha subunit